VTCDTHFYFFAAFFYDNDQRQIAVIIGLGEAKQQFLRQIVDTVRKTEILACGESPRAK
jgi:hypothetical protein